MPTPTATDTQPTLGTPIEAIETPALVVDLDAMDRNIEWYATFAEEHGVRLRSHVKTHKTPALAHKQHDRTNGGICCQTLSEAEVMASGGIDDIYLSYMVVGERKLNRLLYLADELSSFATTVDGRGNVDPLQSAAADYGTTIDVIMEIDIGLGRTGVPTREQAIELAAYISDQPNLSFRGLLAYEAHIKHEAESAADFERLCEQAMDDTAAIVAALEAHDIDVPEVKVGGTATSLYSGTHPVVTEINPGMYPFMDVGELELRPWEVSFGDCAATVLSTVISVPDSGRAVIDAGSKSLGMDKPQQPVVKDRDGVTYVASSEEHGWLDTSDRDEPLTVGDRVSLVVPHVCTTVNLYDTIVGVREGRVTAVWNVQARGKVK
ncbi:alanine racemase [Halalkalicoccus sp. NIPERK01]|uniref:alanine racemase n=1 Tax=Halalkalicoccus sp. NIPERK01 TaxID=3053469 RepID=UPI00256EA4A5|nr:alanine racemase [Halalkalicoccus sp. NIPERK01]